MHCNRMWLLTTIYCLILMNSPQYIFYTQIEKQCDLLHTLDFDTICIITSKYS